jgi:hypothetical protein
MISIVYVTCRGPWPLTSDKMRALGQYDTLAQSLKAQTYDDWELVVVDHWGRTPRPELQCLGSRVRYVQRPASPWDRLWAKNVTLMRQTGLQAATGDVVLGLDDCVGFGPDLLQLVATCAREGRYLAPTCVTESGSVLAGWFDKAGGILAYPRKLALECGGHELRFAGAVALEDWEFSARLVRAGMQIVHDPKAVVTPYQHAGGIAAYHRCCFAVAELLKTQTVANRKWTPAELEVFTVPECPYRDLTKCELARSPCQFPRRPSPEAIAVMRECET